MKSIYSKVYRDIIGRLRRARRDSKLTQKDVADKLKVTQPYISKIEACQLRVDIVQLKKFAELYGKTLNDLLDDAPSEALAAAEEPQGYSASGPGPMPLRDPLDSVNFAVRDPLNAMIGLSELLLKTELNQEQRRYVSGISASSDDLLRQVKGIVDSSRLESGKVQLETSEFDLRETLEQAIRLSRPGIQAKSLDVLCFVDPAIPQKLQGDQYCLGEVLYNLLAASVAGASENETVTVCVEKAPEPSSLLEKRGPADRLQLQFLIHAQRPPYMAGQAAACGGEQDKGLAIAKAFLEKMGGVLWADTGLERGCEFRFSLSLAVPPETAPASGAKVFKGMRAILLSSSRERRRVLSALCASWGMDVFWAEDIASLEKGVHPHDHKADLVIYDCLSEEGVFPLDKLRRLPPLKNAKVLALSRHQLPDKVEAPDAVLVSPVCQNLFFEALRRLLLPQKNKAKARPEAGKPRVLAVEDNPVTAKLLKIILSDCGYCVDSVCSGQEAVECAVRKDYDMVVMDLYLPDVPGSEAAASIIAGRREAGKKPCVIIGISADDSRQARSRALKSGMDAFYAKPLGAASLASLTRRHLQKKQKA